MNALTQRGTLIAAVYQAFMNKNNPLEDAPHSLMTNCNYCARHRTSDEPLRKKTAALKSQ